MRLDEAALADVDRQRQTGETRTECARRLLLAGLEIGVRLQRIEALLTGGAAAAVVPVAGAAEEPEQPDPDAALRLQFAASIEAFGGS